MLKLKQVIITGLLLIAFGLSAIAQNPALSPYEGATHVYAWTGLQSGMEYEFYLTANSDGTGIYDDGLTDEFDFLISPSGTIGVGESEATVEIVWNTGASLKPFYVWIDVHEPGGCSNYRYVGVSPMPNNRSAEFDITASTECFNTGSNSFTLPVNLLDNTGQPLSALYFPMMVEFTVNGTVQSQLVGYNNQLLSINEDWFAADPTQNSDITVEIINVTDAKNATVKPDVTNATHTRTLFAIPEIEFTEELRNRYNLNEKITAYNISSTERVWRMEPK
jgi:hypothetical protein